MRPIQRVIHAGFATAAIASASVPALAWTVWPDVDFEWYANVGRTSVATSTVEPSAAAPAGEVRGASGGPIGDPRAAPVDGQQGVPPGSSFSTAQRSSGDREGRSLRASPDADRVDRAQ